MTVLARPLPRRLMINSGSIFAGEASARLTTFLVAVVVARSFGPIALGQYGYAVAVASVLLLIPDAGLHLFMVRELAAAPGRLGSIFWRIHWLKFALLAVALALTLFLGQWTIQDSGRRTLLYLLAAKAALQTFSQAYMAVFKAFERMHFIALQQFANALLAATWVAVALVAHASVTAVVLALVAGQGIETWIGWQVVRRVFEPGSPRRHDSTGLRPMLFASLPMGAAAILQALNLRLDILTLSPFATNRELGTFQAAAWFPVGAFLAFSLLLAALFPKLARLLRSPGTVGSRYVEGFLRAGVLATAAGSVVAGLLAPILLHVTFGQELAPAASTLRVLVVAFPCIFVNTTMFFVFVAARRRSAYLTALIVGFGVGGPLSLVLSARFGPNGTALADVFRELLISVIYLWFLKTAEFAKSGARALLKVFASATALIVLAAFVTYHTVFIWDSGLVWSFGLLVGTVVFMGWPRFREVLQLADDDI